MKQWNGESQCLFPFRLCSVGNNVPFAFTNRLADKKIPPAITHLETERGLASNFYLKKINLKLFCNRIVILKY